MGWELLWGRTHEAPAGPGCTAARTACGWGFCPLGEEAPGLPMVGWGTSPSLGPAPVAKGSFPPEIPMARETPRRTSRTSSRQQARDRLWPRRRTLSPQCPLCCTRPRPLSVPPGCNPVPFSKAELLLMLQDVVLESPLPESLPSLCPPSAAPPTPCGGWGGASCERQPLPEPVSLP